MTLSKYLKSCRSKSGLTQKEISDTMGWTTAQFVSNWERGLSAPPILNVKKLCKLIGAKPDVVKFKMIKIYKAKLDRVI